MRTALRWLLAITVLFGGLVVPIGAMQEESTAASCAPITVIGVRGSTEPTYDNDGNKVPYTKAAAGNAANMGPTVSRTFTTFYGQSVGDMDIKGRALLYPAALPKNPNGFKDLLKEGAAYPKSVSDGVKKLKNELLNACKTTQFVLIGYSQGADVIANAFLRGLAKTSVYGETLPDSIRKRIKGIVLYARPFWSPKIPSTIPSKSYCNDHDPVCENGTRLKDDGLKRVKTCFESKPDCTHFHYGKYTEQAGEWLASLFKKKSTPKHPTPTPEPVPTPDQVKIDRVVTQDAQGNETTHFTCGETVQLMMYYSASSKVHVVIRYTVFGNQLPVRGEKLTGSGRYRIDAKIPDINGKQTFTAFIDYSKGTVSKSTPFTVACGAAL